MNNPALASVRRSDLDALRAGAMLLGIVLHAALSFFPAFWVVTDSRQEPAFGVLVAAIHGFRMPLFFVMSGYFSGMLLDRRGRGGLLRHRFRRVFLPLLLGMVTVIPATTLISGYVMSAAEGSSTGATQPKSDLWAAADAGDLSAIERHLAGGTEVDARDAQRGLTPLLWAALADQAEAAELLIRRGADANATAGDGATPLHAAAFLGNEKTVAALVRGGAKVNPTNNQGQTPLDSASVDEPTTKFYASLLGLELNEEGLAARKERIAEFLRQHGGTAGKQAGITGLLMQMPLFNHLWFLWFLWWLVIGLVSVSLLATWVPSIRLPDSLVLSPARYLWLVPLTMLPQSFMQPGTFGPDTSAGLLPIPHVLAYYAVFFGFGAIYFAHEGSTGAVGRHWGWQMALGLLVAFPLGFALSLGWSGPTGYELDSQTRWQLGLLLQSAYPWLMTFGLMGLFWRYCPGESPTIRYLSDSAYWLYLAHLPLIIAAQYLVRDWPLAAPIKFFLIVVSVTGFLLWTYQTLVRYRWLGRLLNGPRVRPEPQAMSVPAE